MGTASEVFGQLFSIGLDVLITTLDTTTKAITAQLGDSTRQKADSDVAEWWQHVGFASRPKKPTQGGDAAKVLAIRRSDHDITFASKDARTAKRYGQLADGETCVFASEGQAAIFFKKNGAVVLCTTSDNTDDGRTLTLYWGPDKVQLTHAGGGAIFDPNVGWTITAGAAALILTKNGDAKLVGKTASVAGAVAAIAGDVMTMVGKLATNLNPAIIGTQGPGSSGVSGVASQTVMISP